MEPILDDELVRNDAILVDDLTAIERLKAMLLDHCAVGFFVWLGAVSLLFFASIVDFKVANYYIMLSLFAFYLTKDSIRGRSLAKRALGQVVVNIHTGQTANELRCVLRNSTDFIWPIEVIIVLVNPSRRLGDFIAGTKVVRTEKERINTFVDDCKETNKLRLIKALLLAYVITWIFLSAVAPTAMQIELF